MARITLRINGTPRTVDVSPDTPLLWVLRDDLGLTGTKYGCGVSACGSCTVLDGADPIRSCRTTIAEAAGRSITTIEGLSSDGTRALQRAWLEEDVSQCGYCQPGMLVSAAALLKRRPGPTDAEIDAAMSDVVCRCGTYPRIRRAIHRAAASLRSGR